MLDQLPSLRGFQPHFYTGDPTRWYLALLYDLVATTRPGVCVTLGFGDGQAHFTICQAVREIGLASDCVAVRIERANEVPEDDASWVSGRAYSDEFYRDLSRLEPASSVASQATGSVDLLFINDVDSGSELTELLREWTPKLSARAVVCFHGLELERGDSPANAWRKWTQGKIASEWRAGIGLGIAQMASDASAILAVENQDVLAAMYRLAAERIDADARAAKASRQTAAFATRQVWLDSLLANGWEAQAVMDHQARAIAELERKLAAVHADRDGAQLIMDEQARAFQALRRDRAKAQLVMDSQQENLQHWMAEHASLEGQLERLCAELKERKQLMKFAKAACRRDGRCFHISAEPKVQRSVGERITRELLRIGRKFRAQPQAPAPAAISAAPAASSAPDRYADWIAANEPDAAALEAQRTAAALLPPALLSIVIPTFDTAPRFLDELFHSIAAQTYARWEICIADGGSQKAETLALLARWEAGEPRLRVVRLPENLGISENTNRALALARGDFIFLVDHDDLLPPFALYEFALVLAANPEADVIYSDEDRWSEGGKRRSPFFKPDWSPELLQSFMYLGHLTAYRRELVRELGGFRKEFDLSQDYDLALRATERARAILRVPHVCYHWREHPASGSMGGKPEARKSNLAALGDAMQRRNRTAEILEYPAANRARLIVAEWPRVSVIVPTDSPTRARACLLELPARTRYPDLEIVIVTNSRLAQTLGSAKPADVRVQVVPYDKPFNFSDKCNVGAAAATGARVIFYNDDVEAGQEDWVQQLIEQLENPEVGAVAPKLVYETGKIQHAGLVTGVRGFVGTAFHQQPADSNIHVNFAQSLRDVSALSGACLAMRRDDFLKLGGFDAVNTPINHSDVDLCFRVREAGMRCVYTPFATLKHLGHVSLGHEEKRGAAAPKRDVSSIFLLNRWGDWITRDPFYTTAMRDWLFADSPTPIRMSARNQSPPFTPSRNLLFASHDLTLSGAPILLLHLATWCRDHGIFVTIVAPETGPLAAKYEAAGLPLIIDPLIETGHESALKFVRDFDCVLANTIRGWPIVRAARQTNVPVLWWLHETEVGEHFLREDAKLRASISLADVIFTPSERTSAVYRPFTDREVRQIRYGIPDLAPNESKPALPSDSKRPLQFLLLGSVEPRKGQDVFLQALALVQPEILDRAEFRIVGRIMDPEFGARVELAAAGFRNLTIESAIDHQTALTRLRDADVLVCSSRDEAMPVTILEAMSLGKILLSTTVGGIPEFVSDHESGLLVQPENPAELATAITRLVEDAELRARLQKGARRTFEANFALDRFGEEFSALVHEVISSRPDLAWSR